jgi:predicted DNA-binding antitoxin AbrB/MazE fold protein
MTATAKAVYENGVLRLNTPVDLAEGTVVEIVILTPPTEADRQKTPAEIMREIAALPPDGPLPDDGLSGSRDHDKILYGGPKGAL